MNATQIPLIHKILNAAEAQGTPAWPESGWAIEARLGRITRKHEDIDLAVPHERFDGFKPWLESVGCGPVEETDCGFLVRVGDVLLDCEPRVRRQGAYELGGFPSGSCPWEKQGRISRVAIRCTSWEAMGVLLLPERGSPGGVAGHRS